MGKKNDADISKVNHMDMANQIDNKWERDTIIAFVNEQKNYGYTLRLRNKDKSILKKKFINTKNHLVNLID